MSTIILPIEMGACAKADLPRYCEHKRGTNWFAVIAKNPSAPGGLDRQFCQKANGAYGYMLNVLKVGDVIENAGDYTSGGGNRSRGNRFYGMVTAISEEDVTIEEYDAPSEAFAAQKEFKKGGELAGV